MLLLRQWYSSRRWSASRAKQSEEWFDEYSVNGQRELASKRQKVGTPKLCDVVVAEGRGVSSTLIPKLHRCGVHAPNSPEVVHSGIGALGYRSKSHRGPHLFLK